MGGEEFVGVEEDADIDQATQHGPLRIQLENQPQFPRVIPEFPQQHRTRFHILGWAEKKLEKCSQPYTKKHTLNDKWRKKNSLPVQSA